MLQSIPKPYGEDIIEDIFLEIEKNPDWLQRFTQLSDRLGQGVVDQWIGKYTKENTGLKTGAIKIAQCSILIRSYTSLV